ncbi:hypothetical protein [Bacillus marinisedimentorum]|uniref:hypothetical protein n=1 Tax=Bacillus marinisedimentorum TaxID=1821260 RepID=UPI0007E25390|nr:hypothetical protein [Bacillus marinisedimentorum]
MNIYEALSNVPKLKKEYFLWKHDIRYDQRLPKKTEKEFLRYVGKKTLNGFIAWERTADYKQLLAIYLNGLIANDLDDIYKKVSEQAKSGDPQSVKLFLQLQKDISSHAKLAEKAFSKPEEDEIEEDDDLEI